MQSLLVTGGAGFIGSNFVDMALQANYQVVVLDALTYAGHIANLNEASKFENYIFVEGDIADQGLVPRLLEEHQVDAVINFAAESHVDRSIDGPAAFIQTNVIGTFNLLDSARKYWQSLDEGRQKAFRYLQVSTDEVYGELGDEGKFSEASPYAPNSPYSASKAGADHLVRAWHHTYGLPTITTNCSNNYGPRQFPEKLIPLMISKALSGEALPVYGKGENIRDWIHVQDHCGGILKALSDGKPGETYCFGGNSERKNLDVVKTICQILDQKKPRSNSQPYANLISFVQDRAGHDWRYAIDDSKALKELGYSREFKNFEVGLENTIDWYLKNQDWCDEVLKESKS